MKKGYAIILALVLLLTLPVTVFAGGTALDRTINAGWTCIDIGGDPHCFDPGDGKSNNTASINVKVYNQEGTFLGTEQLWRADLYAGQPCPQDQLLDLGAFIACHHYSH